MNIFDKHLKQRKILISKTTSEIFDDYGRKDFDFCDFKFSKKLMKQYLNSSKNVRCVLYFEGDTD